LPRPTLSPFSPERQGPMTIPYFEPYQGKPPIVERVPACNPRDGAGRRLVLRNDTNPLWWEPCPAHNVHSAEVPNIAAALTRDAIKCWCANVQEYAPTEAAAERCTWLLPLIHHIAVNEAAHALADALEQPHAE
jgi:hypothetical protein